MKKTALTLSMLLFTGIAVYADGNAFTPLNFNDTSYSGNTTPAATTNYTQPVQQAEEVIGNGSIQNAIEQLDNAQVDIRNDLLNYKTKYADVDAQYKLIKTERSALKKQVKSVEKRIKELNKAKEQIRKNML